MRVDGRPWVTMEVPSVCFTILFHLWRRPVLKLHWHREHFEACYPCYSGELWAHALIEQTDCLFSAWTFSRLELFPNLGTILERSVSLFSFLAPVNPPSHTGHFLLTLFFLSTDRRSWEFHWFELQSSYQVTQAPSLDAIFLSVSGYVLVSAIGWESSLCGRFVQICAYGVFDQYHAKDTSAGDHWACVTVPPVPEVGFVWLFACFSVYYVTPTLPKQCNFSIMSSNTWFRPAVLSHFVPSYILTSRLFQQQSFGEDGTSLSTTHVCNLSLLKPGASYTTSFKSFKAFETNFPEGGHLKLLGVDEYKDCVVKLASEDGQRSSRLKQKKVNATRWLSLDHIVTGDPDLFLLLASRSTRFG